MITQTLRFQYRLNPTETQAEQLALFAAWARGVWNLLWCETQRQYEQDQTFLFYKQLAERLKVLKKQPGFEWLRAFDSAAAIRTIIAMKRRPSSLSAKARKNSVRLGQSCLKMG